MYAPDLRGANIYEMTSVKVIPPTTFKNLECSMDRPEMS